ncbi:MAG: DUF4258 domain-containing protein [Candidatus Taylorbacteria bacterium]|nr:DUF4258 domain-containing protein [Candidatus Taylorbacteria bacterium]
MKRVILTEHARYQMGERKIDRTVVIKTLAQPNKTRLQPSGRKEAVRRITKNGKPYCAIVIYEETPEQYRVITIFISSKLKKYLS